MLKLKKITPIDLFLNFEVEVILMFENL